MKLPTLLASLSLLSVGALAGCPSPDAHDARFADASDVQLARSYAASSGSDVSVTVLIGILFSGAPTDATSCPTVVTSGADTTLSGGCDTTDGDHWEGTIAIHNLPGFFTENPAYDATQPGSVTFNALHITSASDEVRLDGVTSIDVPNNDVDADFDLLTKGIQTTTRLHLACDANNFCTASDSEIDVSDLGGAGVEGKWTMGDPATGTITLHGADDLVFDQGSKDANGCLSYTIGSKTGTVCDPNADSGSNKRGASRLPAWASAFRR